MTKEVVLKDFKTGPYTVKNVPYHKKTDAADSVDNELYLSGSVALKLSILVGNMRKCDVFSQEYHQDI